MYVDNFPFILNLNLVICRYLVPSEVPKRPVMTLSDNCHLGGSHHLDTAIAPEEIMGYTV